MNHAEKADTLAVLPGIHKGIKKGERDAPQRTQSKFWEGNTPSSRLVEKYRCGLVREEIFKYS